MEENIPVKVTALVFPFSHCLNQDTFHYLQHYRTILNPGHKISKTRKEKTGNVICLEDSHPFFVSFCISQTALSCSNDGGLETGHIATRIAL